MTSSGRKMSGPDTPHGALLQRLEGIPEHEQHAILVDLVCATIATVLRSVRPEEIDPDRAVQELLGFDSLAAVAMSNQLTSATGLAMAATVIFDYPQPTVLAGYLHGELVEPCTPENDRSTAIAAPMEKNLADMDLDDLVNTALHGDDT